ncbi:MAG: histone deacetylase, partial [Acidobacteriota bacterium]
MSSKLIAYTCDEFVLPLPDGHRFPMLKYRRLRERAVTEGVLLPEQLQTPAPIDDASILRVHTREYLESLVEGTLERSAVRLLGFPWSPALLERSRRSASATYLAARSALERSNDGLRAGINLAGGTHHAFPDHGEGFCVLNDAAIALRKLQHEGHIERALVVDCDVHQGNGTAVIFERDETVFTLSIHGRRNYPFRKKRSSLDVELENDTGDDAYLAALRPALAEAVGAARADVAIKICWLSSSLCMNDGLDVLPLLSTDTRALVILCHDF